MKLTDGTTATADGPQSRRGDPRSRRGVGRLTTLIVAAAAVLASCGGDDDDSSGLAGYRIEPVPEVADVTLPDLTDGGADFHFRAQPESLLVVYFGYTNCPDFCPSTMANVKLARQQLDDPEQVDVAMVTIDPGRDLDVLPAYVTSFVPDAHALGTDDFEALDRAAAPFGVSYEVKQAADGETEVAHTTSLYAVDDAGQVVLTWPFGVTIDQLAGDFEQLLADAGD